MVGKEYSLSVMRNRVKSSRGEDLYVVNSSNNFSVMTSVSRSKTKHFILGIIVLVGCIVTVGHFIISLVIASYHSPIVPMIRDLKLPECTTKGGVDWRVPMFYLPLRHQSYTFDRDTLVTLMRNTTSVTRATIRNNPRIVYDYLMQSSNLFNGSDSTSYSSKSNEKSTGKYFYTDKDCSTLKVHVVY